MSTPDARPEERVLVLAPRGRDGALLCDTLRQSGVTAVPCANVVVLCEHMAEGAAAAVITEEALRPDLERLVAALNSQPVWSDFPIILLTESREVSPALSPAGEVWWKATILPRPISPDTLLSIVRVALRSRRRQYQLRDHIAANQQRVVEILESIGDGFVSLTRDGRCAYVNATLAGMYGVPKEALLGKVIWDALPEWGREPIRGQLIRALDAFHSLEFDVRRPQAWHKVRCSLSIGFQFPAGIGVQFPATLPVAEPVVQGVHGRVPRAPRSAPMADAAARVGGTCGPPWATLRSGS